MFREVTARTVAAAENAHAQRISRVVTPPGRAARGPNR